MMDDLGKLFHWNFKRLAEAGRKHIQIDEPYFNAATDEEVRHAVDALNIAIEGLPEDVHVSMHAAKATTTSVLLTTTVRAAIFWTVAEEDVRHAPTGWDGDLQEWQAPGRATSLRTFPQPGSASEHNNV